MKKEKLNRCIRLILSRLKILQNENGSWAENNFINALIPYSLSEIETDHTSKKYLMMLEKSLKFILSQKKDSWSWNYNQKLQQQKYPDDLDDTFCSLIAIQKIKPKMIDSVALEHIKKLLRNSENQDGIYFTWINSPWNDVDPIVNANIAYFSALKGIKTPKITKYIDRCIDAGFFKSKYYHNPFLSYYFVTRNYQGTKKYQLIRLVFNTIENSNFNETSLPITNIALAACTLINLNPDLKVIEKLIEKISMYIITSKNRSTGSITQETLEPLEPLYIEKIVMEEKYYAYSQAFTLALCAEAISGYLKIKNQNRTKNIQQNKIARRKKMQINATTSKK